MILISHPQTQPGLLDPYSIRKGHTLQTQAQKNPCPAEEAKLGVQASRLRGQCSGGPESPTPCYCGHMKTSKARSSTGFLLPCPGNPRPPRSSVILWAHSLRGARNDNCPCLCPWPVAALSQPEDSILYSTTFNRFQSESSAHCSVTLT